MLKAYLNKKLIEAGCDEAGRGCLSGPVFAAAVILPKKFKHPLLDDSKKLTDKVRRELRPIIEQEAEAWAVAELSVNEIDEINILNASFAAMHLAIKKLKISPQLLLIDGNRFNRYEGIDHKCIIEGDGIYMSIAAASVLAKTYRDDYMIELHKQYPVYDWISNKGYATKFHREAMKQHGQTEHHRKSFHLKENQLQLPLENV